MTGEWGRYALNPRSLLFLLRMREEMAFRRACAVRVTGRYIFRYRYVN